ncbi:hypothetical protein HK102_007806, partial [Quaeritorhiza haematococci]
ESLWLDRVLWTGWDMGGCDRVRPLIRHWLCSVPILVFVINANDRDRITEALSEALIALRVIQDELVASQDWPPKPDSPTDGKPRGFFRKLIFVANKMDFPEAMELDELLLRIRRCLWEGEMWAGTRKAVCGDYWDWALVPCTATTGEGVQDVVDLVHEEVEVMEGSGWSFRGKGGNSKRQSFLGGLFGGRRQVLKKAPEIEKKEELQSTFLRRPIQASKVDWVALEAKGCGGVKTNYGPWTSRLPPETVKESQTSAKSESTERREPEKQPEQEAPPQQQEQQESPPSDTPTPPSNLPPASEGVTITPADPTPNPDLLKRFQETSDTPSSPTAFLEEFEKAEFSGPFDHRAHVRSGFLLIVRERGGRKVVDKITASDAGESTNPDTTSSEQAREGNIITTPTSDSSSNTPNPAAKESEYITASALLTHVLNAYSAMFTTAVAKGTLRNRFHHTMTHFWTYMVLHSLQLSETKRRQISKGEGDIQFTINDFEGFLEGNLELLDKTLWTQYFSGDLMFSEGARSGIVEPDKQKLPELPELVMGV